MYDHSNSSNRDSTKVELKSWEQLKIERLSEGSSSMKEHMENALALGADEGRD